MRLQVVIEVHVTDCKSKDNKQLYPVFQEFAWNTVSHLLDVTADFEALGDTDWKVSDDYCLLFYTWTLWLAGGPYGVMKTKDIDPFKILCEKGQTYSHITILACTIAMTTIKHIHFSLTLSSNVI